MSQNPLEEKIVAQGQVIQKLNGIIQQMEKYIQEIGTEKNRIEEENSSLKHQLYGEKKYLRAEREQSKKIITYMTKWKHDYKLIRLILSEIQPDMQSLVQRNASLRVMNFALRAHNEFLQGINACPDIDLSCIDPL